MGDHISHIVDEALRGTRGAEPIERMDCEIGVAQPAIAVSPIAPLAGASGIDVVSAATMAPVSSKLQSFKVMAARMISPPAIERN